MKSILTNYFWNFLWWYFYWKIGNSCLLPEITKYKHFFYLFHFKKLWRVSDLLIILWLNTIFEIVCSSQKQESKIYLIGTQLLTLSKCIQLGIDGLVVFGSLYIIVLFTYAFFLSHYKSTAFAGKWKFRGEIKC